MSAAVVTSRGGAPLLLAIPHAGTEIAAGIEADLVSPWRARKDVEWWVDKLYGFAGGVGATVVRGTQARSVIDLDCDPDDPDGEGPHGVAAGLCPRETLDGEPLYRPGHEPGAAEAARRRRDFFDPYHAALDAEIMRLRQAHGTIVLLECRATRSLVPRLFAGEAPEMSIGSNGGASSDRGFCHVVQAVCDASGFSWGVNRHFAGGWTIRRTGRPEIGVHALQMVLACRAYMDEPVPDVGPADWPAPYDAVRAAAMRDTLKALLKVCLSFTRRATVARPA